MNSLLQCCVVAAQAMITSLRAGGEFTADVCVLTEDLRERMCCDEKVCMSLHYLLLQRSQSTTLSVLRFKYFEDDTFDVFRNVTTLDTFCMAKKNQKAVVSSVERLRLTTMGSKDEEWIELTTMFPNVKVFEYGGSACEHSFHATKSFCDGSAFPRLQSLTIRAKTILFKDKIAITRRRIVYFSVRSVWCKTSHRWCEMLDPTTIRCVETDAVLTGQWMSSVSELRRCCLHSPTWLCSEHREEACLLRPDGKLGLETLHIRRRVQETLIPLAALLRQERETLVKLTVKGHPSIIPADNKLQRIRMRNYDPQDWQSLGFETMVQNPALLSIILNQGARATIIFRSVSENDAWIERQRTKWTGAIFVSFPRS